MSRLKKIIVAILIVFALGQIIMAIHHEWIFPLYGSGDRAIFLAMGRAMLNGLIPYIDLFETKPPGIFLISALSLAINNDVTFIRIFQIIVIIGIPMVVTRTTVHLLKEEKAQQNIYIIGSAIVFGIALALFSKISAGTMHTESFGAFFGVLYAAFAITSSDNISHKRKLLLGIFLALSLGMKEQFLLPLIAVSLLNNFSWKRFVNTFALPLLIGAVIGIAAMALLGILIPYVTIYLPYIIFEHSSLVDARTTLLPLPLRGFHWVAYVKGLMNPPLLCISIIGLWGFAFFKSAMKGRDMLITIFIALWLTVLSAEMAERNGHQQVVAIPVYVMLFWNGMLFLIQKGSTKAQTICGTIFLSTLLIPIVLSNTKMSLPEYEEANQLNISVLSSAAEIDRVLDACENEKYVDLSVTVDQIYAYTKHSPYPMGLLQHIFRQNIGLKTFRNQMRESMEKTEIILIRNEDFLTEEIAKYLQKYFTTKPPKCAGDINLPNHFSLLFRTNPHGSLDFKNHGGSGGI